MADSHLVFDPSIIQGVTIGFTPTAGLIAANTSDASDNVTVNICGGGAASATRGGFGAFAGNEVASVGGSIVLTGGAIATGNVSLKLGHSSAAIRLQDSSGNNLLSMSHGGNITLNATDAQITSNTSDGADNKAVSIAGGGAVGSSRGGSVECYGNEGSSTGTVFIRAGNVVGGVITFATGGSNRVVLNKDGEFVYSPTTFLVKADTSDAADSKRLALCGGGTNDYSRGAYVVAHGNEFATNGGNLYLNSGNASGANMELSVWSSAGVFIFAVNQATTEAMRILHTGGAAEVQVSKNLSLNGAGSFGSGAGVAFIGNATTVPTTNPTGGGVLYAQAGALKYRGSSGTVTTLGPA